MLTPLLPYFAPTYIVIPESRYTKYQLEELENRLSIVDGQLDTLSAVSYTHLRAHET